MNKEKRAKRDLEIFTMAYQNVPFKEIINQIENVYEQRLTEGRISQIVKEMEKKLEKNPDYPEKLYYFECTDFAVEDKGIKHYAPPILCSAGYIVRESKEAYFVNHIWSKTKKEDIRYSIIPKKSIITKILYERVKK